MAWFASEDVGDGQSRNTYSETAAPIASAMQPITTPAHINAAGAPTRSRRGWRRAESTSVPSARYPRAQ